MKPIANHGTGSLSKLLLRNAWKTGALLPPEHPLSVPVLTTSNHEKPLLMEIMEHDPLFHFDKRPEKQWDLWFKVESADDYASKFVEEGHEYFLYLDSDDGFLWRSFTNEECKEFLGDKDIRFQRGGMGLCAGCFIARADAFSFFAALLRGLRDLKSEGASRTREWIFCDQAAWGSLHALMPDRIGVEKKSRVITQKLPGARIKEMEGRIRGLGDSLAAFFKKLGIKSCVPCKKRQEKLNKMFPYKK